MTTAPSKPAPSLVGKVVLGRYRILGHLADGGMGSIYLARSEGAAGFVRAVVIKAVLPRLLGDKSMVELFVREARIMSNLRHPGIVSVIDFAEQDDMLLMVLEYVHGFHLGRWARFMKKTARPFPVDLGCYIIQHVLRALHYAHTLKDPSGKPLGIVHRDVTPSNVLIDVEGHVKLADFGIARASAEHTDAGANKMVKGKFPYLAPELFDAAEPTPVTDVYSAGVSLHELLVGKNEFHARDMKGTVARVMQHVPTRVDQVRPEVSPGLADVLVRALAKDPRQRFASAAEFAEALSRVRTHPEEELARRLSESAAADFLDKRMAETLRMPQLADLEASWSTPVSDRASLDAIQRMQAAITMQPPEDDDADVVVDGAPAKLDFETDAQTPVAQLRKAAAAARGQPPRGNALVWLLVGGGSVALAGAIILLVMFLRRDPAPPEGPTYVVVDERGAAGSPPGPATPEPAAVTPPAAPAPVTGSPVVTPAAPPALGPPAAPVKPAESVATRLTRTFGRQKAKVTECFQQHAVEVSGAPELSVRLEVGTDGAVTAAELSPAEIAGTGLGKCLLAVARATRFDPLAEPVAFRVPIKAKARDE